MCYYQRGINCLRKTINIEWRINQMTYLRKTNAVIAVMVIMLVGFCSVMNVDAASVGLSKTSVSLEAGETVNLSVKGTGKKVSWSSSNKKVATVSKKGKVKALKKGSANIYARVDGKKLTCKVKVKALPMSKYWTADSQAAAHLRAYVKKVTNKKDKENYIPVKDRIAVFDMDGTLTCEQYFTYYDTMMFLQYCLKDHPDEVSDELKKAAQEVKPGYKAGEELARNFAKAYAGMTVEELYNYAVEFGNKETSSFRNMKYNEGAYLPMVELVKYLYDNKFTIYVISGTERTTTRAVVDCSPYSEYVPQSQVIGTEFEVKVKGHESEAMNLNYKYVPGDELVFTGGFIQKNLHANKAIEIEREIGQRPVLAFGNSGSDSSMLDYTIDSRNPYPTAAYMVVADDPEREWGKESWDDKSASYIAKNYVPISMKNEFKQIYKSGITKAEKQYDPEEWKSTEDSSQNGKDLEVLRDAA